MKPTRLIFAFVLTLLSFNVSQTFAQQGTWEHLGTRKVNHRVDHDEILVTWTDGVFDAIKVVVTGAPLTMHKCVVHFANGSEQEIFTRNNFAQGSDSRVVDLKGNNRIINRISFWYDTKGLLRGRATLTVYGRH